MTLPASGFDPGTLQLLAFHDEDVEVCFDGVLAAREAGFITTTICSTSSPPPARC